MKSVRVVLALVVAFGLLVGCEKPVADVEPQPDIQVPQGPASYAEAVGALDGIVTKIREAFDAGTPKESDGAIHEAAVILKALPGLIDSAGLSAEDAEGAKTEFGRLRAAISKIHEGFHHGGEIVSYDEVKEGLEGGLAGMKAKLESIAN